MKALAIATLFFIAALAGAQPPTTAVSQTLADYNRSPDAETASQLI